MEDSRGIRRGRCTKSDCFCDAYVPGAGGKCNNCTHLPGLHQKTDGKGYHAPPHYAYSQGIHTPTNYLYNQQASYNPKDYRSSQPSQPLLQTASNSREWSSMLPQHQVHHVPRHRCKVCSKDAYYDLELGKQFEYCSGDCRDKHLLASNVRDTKSDIARLEQSVKQGHADLALPKTKSDGKVNCHKCDSSSIGSAMKGVYSGIMSAVKTERKTLPATDKSSSEISKKSNQGRETQQGFTKSVGTRKFAGTQNAVTFTVNRKPKENLGLFFSNDQSAGLQGCTITGYKRGSPIGKYVYKGVIHLLDVVVQVNGMDFKNCKDFDKKIQDCSSVDLKCHVQDFHVENLCGFDVPQEVTHVFAIRCSHSNNSIGIEVSGYRASIKTFARKSLAEDCGLRVTDNIKMFAVMVTPGHTRVENFTSYTQKMFVEKLNEAFKEVSSSFSTMLLFIHRL